MGHCYPGQWNPRPRVNTAVLPNTQVGAFVSLVSETKRAKMIDVSTPPLTLMFEISEELANIARRDVHKRYMVCWTCQLSIAAQKTLLSITKHEVDILISVIDSDAQ